MPCPWSLWRCVWSFLEIVYTTLSHKTLANILETSNERLANMIPPATSKNHMHKQDLDYLPLQQKTSSVLSAEGKSPSQMSGLRLPHPSQCTLLQGQWRGLLGSLFSSKIYTLFKKPVRRQHLLSVAGQLKIAASASGLQVPSAPGQLTACLFCPRPAYKYPPLYPWDRRFFCPNVKPMTF